MLALEQAMDELALRLDIDPVELRIRNEPTQDPEKNVPFSTRALVPCLQEGARRFGWDKRNARPGRVRDGNWLFGMGMAAASRGNILRPAEARVTMTSARNAVVEMDMTDIGTGSYTVFAQIAAELLDLPVGNIEVRLGHSSYPITPGSGGSFGASSCGAALHDACTRLKARLDAGEGAQGLTVTGQVKPGDDAKKFSQNAYGAHFAEVAVEATTGEVRLRRMLGVFAAGRILNAKTARSQLIGGMIWGVSAALHENTVLDPRFGAFITQDLANYHVPVHADIGEVEAVMLDEFDRARQRAGLQGRGRARHLRRRRGGRQRRLQRLRRARARLSDHPRQGAAGADAAGGVISSGPRASRSLMIVPTAGTDRCFCVPRGVAGGSLPARA